MSCTSFVLTSFHGRSIRSNTSNAYDDDDDDDDDDDEDDDDEDDHIIIIAIIMLAGMYEGRSDKS